MLKSYIEIDNSLSLLIKLIKNDTTIKILAEKLNTSQSNLYHKFSRGIVFYKDLYNILICINKSLILKIINKESLEEECLETPTPNELIVFTKKKLVDKSLTQTDLAKYLNLSKSSLSQKFARESLRITDLEKIFNFLNSDVILILK